MNIKNNTLAIPAAPAAIPPNPKIPATIARIIKITVHFNMIFDFKLIYNVFFVITKMRLI